MQLITGLSYMTSDTDAKQHFFAFKYHPDFAKLDHGWKYTDLVKEYVRQGIYDMSNHWKVRVCCIAATSYRHLPLYFDRYMRTWIIRYLIPIHYTSSYQGK